MKTAQQHHFFLHDPTLQTLTPKMGQVITLSPEVTTRIATILRLREKELCTLFCKTMATTVELTSISAGKGAKIVATITSVTQHAPLRPEITLICGVTKQPTFEEICFTATQLGVTQIFPIITTKSYTKPYTAKDLQKFRAHAIAAAEQSKQIILPVIHEPQRLSELCADLETSPSAKIMFEADGSPFKTMLSQEAPTNITLAFGPEGGFTPEECVTLEACGFTKTRLCSPILRTQDAVEVGLGIIRCLF